jgi:hypothetical protein
MKQGLVLAALVVGSTLMGDAQPTTTAGDVLATLAGNWRLVSFVNIDESGAERDAGYDGGRIMYDVAGNMAAQLLRKSR